MKDGVGFSKQQSQYTHCYGPRSLAELKALASDKFFCVRPTKSVYDKTVRSWDNRPPTPYAHSGWSDTVIGESYERALAFLDTYYGPLFEDPIMSSEELSENVDWSKSPGFPYTHFGYDQKKQLVPVLDLEDQNKINEKVYLHCAFKIEFLPTTDIANGKGRIYQIPPLPLLYSQLKFGKRISLKLKMYHWSMYGFNPYSGGFNRLAENLLTKPWRGCYDVSGWDKYLCVLRDLYKVLRNRANLPDEQVKEFEWMVNNTCCFLLKLMDGTVLFKDYGNASGSGTTTRDNILAHVIIFATGLFFAYYVKYEIFPTLNRVFQQVVSLFGDDNVFGVDEDFSLMCDENFLRTHLGQFGLKLKFFVGGKDHPLEELSFLGAHFKKISGLWYPKYDVVRLATTMVYEIGGPKTLDLKQTLGKIFTLTIMSYPTEKWELFKTAYGEFLKHPQVLEKGHDPEVSTYLSVGVPCEDTMKCFYQGLESGCFSGSVVFFQNHFNQYL